MQRPFAQTAIRAKTTPPEISNTVSGEEAQELPLNGRNFEQLGSLMPGVINTSPVATMGTGGYSTTNSLRVAQRVVGLPIPLTARTTLG